MKFRLTKEEILGAVYFGAFVVVVAILAFSLTGGG
jgi:hypothetical protein